VDINQALKRAETYHRGGQLEEAAKSYEAVVRIASDNADAQYGLGTALMQLSRPTEALVHLEMAADLLPTVPEFLFNLALAEKQLGLAERAKASLLRAAFAARGDAYYLLPICKPMIELGLAQQAFSYLDATGDQSPKISLWKARAQGAMGDWGGALKILGTLTVHFPDDAEIWREHSKAAGYLRDFDTAIKSYFVYLDKTEVAPDDYLAFADLYLTAQMPKEAVDYIQRAFDAGVDKAEAHLIAGKCARLDGDYEALKKHLAKAIERRPTFGQAWQLLLEVSDHSELTDLARETSKYAEDDRCTHWDRLLLDLTSGRALEKQGKYTEAFTAFERGNRGHKDLMARRDLAYDSQTLGIEGDKIRGHFPVGGQYAQASARQKKQAIFVLGMPRSGTTLVEKILTCLKGVQAGGENEALEFVTTQYYWDLAQGRCPPPTELRARQLNDMAEAYWRRNAFDGPIITDKMPHNFRHVGLITQMLPDAPILFMKRDPMDVCLSIYCRLFPDAHRYACDLDWLAHFYAESERLKTHWKTVFPDRVLEVVYEELVENPVEKTQEIAKFCGLGWHAGCLDFHKKQGASFTFSEIQVRKPLNKDGIGRWHHYEKQLIPLKMALEKYGVL